jgi:hypothetical protein
MGWIKIPYTNTCDVSCLQVRYSAQKTAPLLVKQCAGDGIDGAMKCCNGKDHCVQKNSDYSECRPKTAKIPDGWAGKTLACKGVGPVAPWGHAHTTMTYTRSRHVECGLLQSSECARGSACERPACAGMCSAQEIAEAAPQPEAAAITDEATPPSAADAACATV